MELFSLEISTRSFCSFCIFTQTCTLDINPLCVILTTRSLIYAFVGLNPIIVTTPKPITLRITNPTSGSYTLERLLKLLTNC